jgi:tRNA pseudouridine55 synthase
VLGVGRATRLLTYLVGLNKTYHAEIRLGIATSSDDADGETISSPGASDLSVAQISSAMSGMVGTASQTPPQLSAKKIAGRRAYELARKGVRVELKPREVTINRFTLLSTTNQSIGRVSVIDCDVECEVSSGTYVRAMARDLGEKLGVGGHVKSLRRTKLGPWGESDAVALVQVAWPRVTPMNDFALQHLSVRLLTADESELVRHGGSVPLGEIRKPAAPLAHEVVALVSPANELVAMSKSMGSKLQPVAVFAKEQPA